ncbi:MAG: hypothetical protein A2622_01435 [Bdellovibrionales bacterium RIFCSPHIGHO2_01_FULL_40_29]|nr:MAG: hypothetical protein A2622_01435 [Bdellovibrionales bacterium RIFCSPHIGHO2_01_FULL_40_29]OFZ32768.1 MAG: hypothetical protein A3D17_06035 [Bdellovibrionales bacterium RIFCSPHIGHO2_02_FULL_40_15]
MKVFFNLLLLASAILGCESKDDLHSFQNSSPQYNIINGALLVDTQLPQMSQITIGQTNCSATLVGPNVILTAAHCIGEFPEQLFGPVNGAFYKVKLTLNPKYNETHETYDDNSLALASDAAIGILEKEIPNIIPATISHKNPSINDPILMAGCGAPTEGIRQFGFSRVNKQGSTGFTLSDSNSMQIINHGDSGGPSFMVNEKNELSLFAVNSTSDFSYAQGVSSVVNTPENDNAIFINQFISKNNLKVCGINLKCGTISLIPKGLGYSTSLLVSIDGVQTEISNKTQVSRNTILKSSVKGDMVFAQLGKVDDFTNLDVKGKMVLIARGEIAFLDKMKNAKKAGAVGIIIFNTSDDDINASLDEASDFPILVINNTAGQSLVSSLTAGAKISVEFKVTSQIYTFDKKN